MRYNLRENKSEKLKDFFKITFSHFMFSHISSNKDVKFMIIMK